jgi:GNAT superfamily N-acetyltransferase
MHAAPHSPWQIHVSRIRTATVADAERMVGLINAAFVVERVAFAGDRVDLQGVRSLMTKGRFLVAEAGDSDELAACVYVEPRGERCYLGLLSVAPALQGKGLGPRLAAAAEGFARSAGCRTMELRIISPRAESLLPLYKRLGYVETGTLPFPPEVPTSVLCHYLLMAKPLV